MKVLRGNSEANGSCEGHCGDTFRDLIDIWEENGYCTVEESPDPFCWAEEHGAIILYDFPRIDDRQIPGFRHGLFGNTVPLQPNVHPWIFWARSPRLLMEARKKPLLGYKDRDIESIFLGKVENPAQQHNRKNQDWSTAGVSLFNCPIEKPGSSHYTHTKEEYLQELGMSKFGLCLAGYGPKCNREIELLGMGVVPLFSPEVDNKYHEPMVEGLHFLRVNSPQDVKPTIDSITEETWWEMHTAGQQWYRRNASPEGSFKTTQRILESL